MLRLNDTFTRLRRNRQKALITFITAGHPNPQLTVDLMHTLVEAGTDIIELGVPFSDPMADGPVIQRASEKALTHGVSLADVLDMVSRFRRTDMTTPIVLMGYANPIEAYGRERFVKTAADSGVDGVLTVDYPPEESAEFVDLLNAHGIAPIFTVAPTTGSSRLGNVLAVAQGFLYYVALCGVTGASHVDIDNLAGRIEPLRKLTRLPIAVGFGINSPEKARQAALSADAIVVGSRIVQEIENSPEEEVLSNVFKLIRAMHDAIQQERNEYELV